MKTLIIQASPMQTGSTILINAVQGLFPHLSDKAIMSDKAIISGNPEHLKYFKDGDIHMFKTHNTNIDEWMGLFHKRYNLYFVCSQRPEKGYCIDEKYKQYENVIIFNFKELLESNDNPLTKIIDNIHNKLSKLGIPMNKNVSIERVKAMNSLCETIKDKPFTYYDKFYHIHGSHRNRIKQNAHSLEITIGSSNSNIKRINLPQKLNKNEVHVILKKTRYPDTFHFKIIGEYLEIKRTDRTTGWGHDHKCKIVRK